MFTDRTSNFQFSADLSLQQKDARVSRSGGVHSLLFWASWISCLPRREVISTHRPYYHLKWITAKFNLQLFAKLIGEVKAVLGDKFWLRFRRRFSHRFWGQNRSRIDQNRESVWIGVPPLEQQPQNRSWIGFRIGPSPELSFFRPHVLQFCNNPHKFLSHIVLLRLIHQIFLKPLHECSASGCVTMENCNK
jgi:hypothetical protein